MKISLRSAVKLAAEVLALVFASYLIITYADGYKAEKQRAEAEKEAAGQQDAAFDLWYSYKGYKPYLEKAAAEYEKETGVQVRLTYYTAMDYMESISSASAEGKGPDLFLMSGENLQNAVLLGIAEKNYNTELVNSGNYTEKSLEAITYAGSMYGYPMGFETTVFAANMAYVDEMPKTFDDVKTFADGFNDGESTEEHDYSHVSAILRWDISDVMYSYGFLGAYLNVGGELGDNPDIIDVDSADAIKAGEYYNSLAQYFYTDEETAKYENVIDEFLQGKIIYTIASADIIGRLEAMETESGKKPQIELSVLPALTPQLKTKQLSVTDIIMVNPFADMKKEATDFAEYLSYDMSDEMFDICGEIAAKRVEYDNEYVEEFVKAYENSAGMPKLMTTADYWMKAANLEKNIWNGESVSEQLEKLDAELTERIN